MAGRSADDRPGCRSVDRLARIGSVGEWPLVEKRHQVVLIYQPLVRTPTRYPADRYQFLLTRSARAGFRDTLYSHQF